MALRKLDPEPCPECERLTARAHCLSGGCTWYFCLICEIVFSVTGVTAGHSFPRPN